MSLAAQQSLESHYVMHTFGRSPVEFVEGHGMKLTGDDGREYLDFLAGIGVCSLGHGDPAVLSALEAQTKSSCMSPITSTSSSADRSRHCCPSLLTTT
ncbi:MAG: aminotransferase class III-fold pyridoxal phosphate-dependent enzyme [Collinsella sp.]